MAHVAFTLCVFASFLVAKTGAFFTQPGEAAPKRRGPPSPSFLEVPQQIHYFVTRSQPANLTWAATNVCKIQIKCNKRTFSDGGDRLCRHTGRRYKTRKKTKVINASDFPESIRSMTCQCKVWGTKAIKSEKIVVEKAFLDETFKAVQLHHVVSPNTTVVIQCKPPDGSPSPKITWYKNGEPLIFRRGIRLRRMQLVIKRARRNDSGEYQCIAENMAARREGPKIRLEVRENFSIAVCNESTAWCFPGQPPAGCERERNLSSSCDSNPAMLIVGTKDGLLKIDLGNTSRRTQIQVKNVLSLDFSSDTDQIYWSSGKEIKQTSLQTGVSEVIPFHHNEVNSEPFPEDLAVDWLSNKLYWTDAKRDAIYVGDLNNGRKVKIIDGKLDSPKAIAVSPSNGYFYWTNWGQAPHVERARLDGTERKALIDNGINFPNGLALDELDKKLFWAGTDNDKYGIIEAVSLDGLNRSIILYQQGYHPFCLDIFGGYVYWADWGRNAILRIKSRGGEAEIVIDGLNKPTGLKILHRREKSPGNPCDLKNGDCEYVCIHFLQRKKCLCKKEMKPEENGKTCKKKELYVKRDSKNEDFDVSNPVFIIVLLLLLILLVYFAVKKRPSCSRSAGPPRGQRVKRKVIQDDVDGGIEEELATDQTDLMRVDSQPNDTSTASNQQLPSSEACGACLSTVKPNDTSPESNQQLPSSEARGTCLSTVKRDVVVYMTKMNTVNLNTVNMNMTNTNNVALQQSGGVTVIGNEANINYHQPPAES